MDARYPGRQLDFEDVSHLCRTHIEALHNLRFLAARELPIDSQLLRIARESHQQASAVTPAGSSFQQRNTFD